MSIWNKILLGLNFVAALAFFYLGTRALKTHQHWRELARQYQDRVEKARQREDEVRYGLGWNLDVYKDHSKRSLEDRIAELFPSDEALVPGFLEALARLDKDAQLLPSDEAQPEVAAAAVRAEQGMSLREAESRFHEAIASRGKVWRNCQADLGVFDQTGVIRVAGEREPQPLAPAEGEPAAAPSSWLPIDSPVFVFEEYKPDDWSLGLNDPQQFVQKHYLGEFRVKSIGEQDRLVALEPAMSLSDEQKSRIQNRSDWVLYEKMPCDSHRAFAGLKNKQLRTILPEDTVDQYIADGTVVADLQQLVDKGQIEDLSKLDRRKIHWAGWDEREKKLDLVPLKPDEKYVRPLRDYAYLFRYHHEQIAMTESKLAAVLGDLRALTDPQEGALPKMEAQVTFEEGRRDKLEAILTRHETERAELAKHRKRLEEKRDELNEKIETLARENWQMAVQITQLQRRAAEEINARAQGRVARSESSPPGGPGN